MLLWSKKPVNTGYSRLYWLYWKLFFILSNTLRYIYDGDMKVHCIIWMTLSILTVHMQTVTLNGRYLDVDLEHQHVSNTTDKTPHTTFTTAPSLLFYDRYVCEGVSELMWVKRGLKRETQTSQAALISLSLRLYTKGFGLSLRLHSHSLFVPFPKPSSYI